MPIATKARGMTTARAATSMLDYDFMRTAFMAGGIVALLSGTVGYFLVMRGQTFAGHALAHVGFTGATGAVLLGVSPLFGLVSFTVLAGFSMGMLGEKLSGRDVAIGMILSLALGLGLLFLHFYTAYATQVTALLFGNVLGVDQSTIWSLALLAVVESHCARRHRPTARLCQLAARTGRGKGSFTALGFDNLSDDRCGCRCRMFPNRRRAPGFHADGWSGGRGAKTNDLFRPRRWAVGAARTCRGVGRNYARLLDRLADKLLDYPAFRHCLFRQSYSAPAAPVRANHRGGSVIAQGAAIRTAAGHDKRECLVGWRLSS